MKIPATEALVAEYQRWNEEQGLDLGSADEHLFDESLTEEQRVWLTSFCERWRLHEGRLADLWQSLLSAAQEAVANGESEGGDYLVDRDSFDALKAAVQAIHDDAVATIERD